MKGKLEDIIKNYSSGIGAKKREMTAEEKERLRSLGYVGFADGISIDELPDPKDKIDEFRMIHQAKMYEFRENYQEAAKIFEKILSLRPHTPSSYVNLALVYAKMKKFDEAIHVLEQGIERIPDSEILLSRLGHTYLALGRLKKAISIHPTPLAFYNLAVALRKAGNLKEAIHYLKLYLENAKGVDEATIRKAREGLSAWENMLRQ